MTQHVGAPIHFSHAEPEKAAPEVHAPPVARADEETPWGDIALAVLIPGAILLVYFINYLVVAAR